RLADFLRNRRACRASYVGGQEARQPSVGGGRGVPVMKTESLSDVKNNLGKVIAKLPRTGAVRITKNGRTRAVLFPANDNTDMESLILSQDRRFWRLFDRSIESGK